MSVSRRSVILTGLAAGLARPAQAAPPGVILTGGPIYDGQGATVEAVAVQGETILFVGPLADARSRLRGAREVDLAGQAAYPGFVDSHAHLTGIGLREMTLNLEGTASIADLKARVRAHAAANPKGPIIGRGWIETHWPEARFPTRQDIDAVTSDRPVYLTRADGHAGVANSAALQLAGVTASTVDPKGGQILRDASGAPTGMLVDNAQALVASRMPRPTREMRREALQRAGRLYVQRGWTGAHNMSVSTEDLALMQALDHGGAMPLRVNNYLDLAEAADVLAKGPSRKGKIHVNGAKLYADGALGSRGAALLAPYADAPNSSGLLVTQPDVLVDAMRKAVTSGAQIAIHAIGDRGNRVALDAMQTAVGDTSPPPRWRIEHAQVLALEDIPRLARQNVVASMQPSHAIGDLYFAPARLGSERLKGAYAWRRLLQSGARICGGSDAPVEKGDLRIEFYAAAYRHALDGYAGPDWGLDQALTRQEALALFTTGAAYAVGQEKRRGVLAAGYAADITVLSRDLMTIEPAEMLGVKPTMTMVAGKIVHQA